MSTPIITSQSTSICGTATSLLNREEAQHHSARTMSQINTPMKVFDYILPSSSKRPRWGKHLSFPRTRSVQSTILRVSPLSIQRTVYKFYMFLFYNTYLLNSTLMNIFPPPKKLFILFWRVVYTYIPAGYCS